MRVLYSWICGSLSRSARKGKEKREETDWARLFARHGWKSVQMHRLPANHRCLPGNPSLELQIPKHICFLLLTTLIIKNWLVILAVMYCIMRIIAFGTFTKDLNLSNDFSQHKERCMNLSLVRLAGENLFAQIVICYM